MKAFRYWCIMMLHYAQKLNRRTKIFTRKSTMDNEIKDSFYISFDSHECHWKKFAETFKHWSGGIGDCDVCVTGWWSELTKESSFLASPQSGVLAGRVPLHLRDYPLSLVSKQFLLSVEPRNLGGARAAALLSQWDRLQWRLDLLKDSCCSQRISL